MKKSIEIIGFMFLIAVLVTLAITPVGGWHPSNPYAELYKAAFCVTTLGCIVCGIYLFVYNINKTN